MEMFVSFQAELFAYYFPQNLPLRIVNGVMYG